MLLFALSGHGLMDMPSYNQYISGSLSNHTISDEEIEENLKGSFIE